MESYKEQDTNAMSVVLAGHLFLSHFLVGGMALIIYENLDVATPTSRIILTMGIAGLLGLLLTLNIQRAIRTLDWALLHLINAIPVRKLSRRGHGPLVGLMARVDGLAERERPFTELRALQLQQNSEAAAQEERNRLARDLHDSIKQQLFSIHIGTAAVQARWEHDPDGAKTAVADVRQNAKAALAEMNALLHQLAPEPLEKVGLVQALQVQCEALGHRSGAIVKADIGRLPEDERFPDGTQTALFRIAQELLSNVARHARAENVLLRLSVSEDALLQLAVIDDGQGFDAQTASSGMGLDNVRQRVEALNGQLEIETASNSGTSIYISIPLQDSSQMKENRMNKPDHLFNKIALIGLLGGIALNLLLRYPLIVALPDVIMPPKPTDSIFLAGLLGLTAVAVTIGIGYFAARQAEMGSRNMNRLVGAIAGGIATLTLYVGYGSTSTNLVGSLPIFEHGLIPAASENLYIWLLIESIIHIVWWTAAGFVLLLIGGLLLGAVGGSLLSNFTPKPDRNWTHLLAGGIALAFSMMLSALLALILTLAIFGLLGEQMMVKGLELKEAGFERMFSIAGTAVLPITIAAIIYFVSLLLLNWLFRLAQKAKEHPHFRLIISTYLAAYVAILSTFFFTVIISPLNETVMAWLDLIIVLVSLGCGLLLLKTAVSLEQRFPESEKRPAWAGIVTIGLFIIFIVTVGLFIVGEENWAFTLLALGSVAYFFTPRYDVVHHTTALGNLMARTLEVALPSVIVFQLTSLIMVPIFLGLVQIVVKAIPSIAFSGDVNGETAVVTAEQIVQTVYATTPLPALAVIGVGSLIILLLLLVIKISQSWKR